MKRSPQHLPWAAELKAANVAFAQTEQALRAEAEDLRAQQQQLLEREAHLRDEVAALRQGLSSADEQQRLVTDALQEAHRQRDELEQAQQIWQARAAAQDLELAALRSGAETDSVAAQQALQTLREQATQQRHELQQALQKAHEADLAALRESMQAAQAHQEHLEKRRGAELQGLREALALAREQSRAQQDALLEHLERLSGETRQAQLLARTLAERDEQLQAMARQLADGAAQAERSRGELEQLRQALQQAARARESEDQRRAERIELEHLAESRAQAELQEQLRERWRQREQQLADAHAHELHKVAEVTQAQRARVAELEAELRVAAEREHASRRETQLVQQGFGSIASGHAAALQALDEARDLQRSRWLQQHNDERLAIIAALRGELDEARAHQQRLQQQTSVLREALAAAAASAAAVVEQPPAAAPAPVSPSAPPPSPAAELPPDTLPAEAAAPVPAPAPEPSHSAIARPAAEPLAMPEAALHEPLTLEGLLALHDHDFVDAAYLHLLGRAPEPEGKAAFLEALRRGTRKQSLLLVIAESAEAQHVAADRPGSIALREQLQRQHHHPTRMQRLGRRAAASLGLDADPEVAENRLRAQLAALRAPIRQALSEIQQQLDRLDGHLVRIDQHLSAGDGRLEELSARVATLGAQQAEAWHAQQAQQGLLQQLLQQNASMATQLNDQAARGESHDAALRELQLQFDQHQLSLLRVRAAGGAAAGGSTPAAPPVNAAALARVRSMLQADNGAEPS